jgi:hypothetical protein
MSALDEVDERLAVRLGLKADHVVVAHEVHQFLVRRHGAQHLGHGKRNMQEKADGVGHTQIAQAASERQQVIVVHPDDVVRANHRDEASRKRFVDAQIPRVVLALEVREIVPVVERRPQRGIGKAAVILVIVAPRESHGRVCDVALLLDDGLRRFADDLAAPAEPDAARFLERVQHADSKTAGGRSPLLSRRNTIRYHD